jgi:hypothetical protein
VKYVFIFFIPGAAGNFFSRCLNLLNHTRCWTDGATLPSTLEERVNLLNYKSVINRPSELNWVTDWESKINHYTKVITDKKNNNMSIWLRHPDYTLVQQVSGADDRRFKIYIDPSNAFEWAILNALYKDSHIESKWLKAGEIMRQDPEMFKISLSNIVQSDETFLLEFIRVCNYLGLAPSDAEIKAVLDLYHQWKTTTLPPEKFVAFKQQIGWH